MRNLKVRGVLAIGAVTGLLLATMSTSAGTAFASDNRGVYICVSSNLPAQCVDLKDDSFSAGQTIYTWDSSTGNGLGWNLGLMGTVGSDGPFVSGSGLNNRYDGDDIFNIEKTTATSHDGCIAATGKYFDVIAWEPCNSTVTDYGTASDDTLWVQTTDGYLISIAGSNQAANTEGTGCSPTCAAGLVDPTPLDPNSNGEFLTLNSITASTGVMKWQILDQEASA